jgi:hypothetical protein
MTGGVLETYQINGATAVDFSNDSLKGFVLAGSNLYVYSKIDALKQIPLAAPGVDVSFLANSAFGYIAEAPPGGGGLVEIRRTCDDGVPSTPVSLAAAPLFIKALSNGNQVVVLDPPYVEMINVTSAPTGCSPTVSNTLQTTDLGIGAFAATQMIVSGDESKLYIVVPGMSSILVFDLFSFTTSGIPLTNNALPVQAALSSDGATLYVAASDGTVHVLSTTSGGDLTQISFPENLCLDSSGNPSPIPCAPNLLAFKP